MMTPEEFALRAAEVRNADFETAHIAEDHLAMDILASLAMVGHKRSEFKRLQALAVAWCALRHEQRPRWFA